MQEILIQSKNIFLGALIALSALFGLNTTAVKLIPTKPAATPAAVPAKPVVKTLIATSTVVTTKTTATTTIVVAKPKPVAKPVAVKPKPVSKPPIAPSIPIQNPPSSPAADFAASANMPAINTSNTASSSLPLTFDQINDETRAALVNILCTSDSAGPINPITGSGMIIDERGVIVTNAHIGQYFLLQNFSRPNFINCVIRKGSPATPAYRAIPIFVSSRWVENNYDNIKSSEPKGTGEDDFALLLITQVIDPIMPPTVHFPFIPFNTQEPENPAGLNVLVSGYAAGFLGGEAIQRSLFSSSALSTIKEGFTFSDGTYDFFDINGNIVAQRGASGGAVVNSKGEMIGLISTVSEATQTSDRSLGAISLAHINRSLLKQTGSDLTSILAGDLPSKALQFNSLIAPRLFQILSDSINGTTPARQ